MGARKKIALTYFYSENWIAGAYYVANMLKAVNALTDEEKPHFVILINNYDGINILKEADYPYISFLNMNVDTEPALTKLLRKIDRKLTGTDHTITRNLKDVRHVFEGGEQFKDIPNHYYWVHDFQECRLPDFFTKEEAENRSALPKKVAGMKDTTLILSSYDALNDFNTYFPGHICDIKLLRFASALPDLSGVDIQEQLQHFKVTKPYFICSNQFWQHKNHRTVLEAIRLLRDKHLDYQVLFTGKNFDHRNPAYFESLRQFVTDNQLDKYVSFLGFIDRKVQLKLAEHAMAYIQPSLFEGWSTTVEDAKCLNQHILLSNIPVHIEQLDYNVTFFDPHQPQDLAAKMENIITQGRVREQRDYQENIRAFGKDIVSMFAE